MARIVLAGYLVRFPLGGYAWQAAHYLLGLRALGHDVWFYEDTRHYSDAYDPRTGDVGIVYDYGLDLTQAFFARLGLADRWVFVDTWQGKEYGANAGHAATLLRDAGLIVNLGGVNRVLPEQRGGRPAVYIDFDPGYTSLACKPARDSMAKYLIINADDFGYARGVNRGIVAAHRQGVVLSTTLMVDASAAGEVRDVAREYPELSVGLHFVATHHGVPLFDLHDLAKVEQELNRQYERCRALLKKPPTHLDSHQHMHLRHKHLDTLFRTWAATRQLPLRNAGVVHFEERFYGEQYDAHGRACLAPERISFKSLEKILRALPEGVTELACHPGYVTADLDSSYATAREIELTTLLDPQLPILLRECGISLINFAMLLKG